MADETPTNAQDDDSKKETIRITLPPKTEPSGINPPPGAITPPPPTSSAPPPPPPTKPLSGAVPPPKPPPLAGKPTVPLRPASPAGSGMQAPGSGIAPRPTSPKKETARINLPTGVNPAPALPKATVKMQQTQPLSKAPSPALSQSVTLHQAAVAAGVAKPDKVTLGLSIAAFVLAGVAVYIVNMISTAAKLPGWAP